MSKTRTRVCFVTGTRAEFGLMHTTLEAIRAHPRLRLQIIATGMHLDPRHGAALAAVRAGGFKPDAVVPWPADSGRSPANNAANTGHAIAALAATFGRLRSDIVLVVGDRVEAFAAAAAAHLSHRIVAHVHGGDRALGQIDDSLRHAITKLAHVHFPATPASAARIARLGEDKWRIHCVGSPGNDGIADLAAPWAEIERRFPGLKQRRFAVLLLHPIEADAGVEERRATLVLNALRDSGIDHIIGLYPNNDPGCSGIIRAWGKTAPPQFTLVRDLPRAVFMGLLRDAAMLVGNSSAGIIEAASFGLPVIDIGPRQAGRERPGNVRHCEYDRRSIAAVARRLWNSPRKRRASAGGVYSRTGAGQRIAHALAEIRRTPKLLQKLINY